MGILALHRLPQWLFRCLRSRRAAVLSLILLTALVIIYPLRLQKSDAVANEAMATTSTSRDKQEKKRASRVEFVHIPKTAGTMMELWAGNHNVSWGKCHWKKESGQCPNSGIQYSREIVFPADPLDHRCSIHHIPPYIMFEHGYSNPYEGADLFTVVRNPYDRFLSEYYHQRHKRDDVHDPDSLETFAKHIFDELHLSGSNRASNVYYMQYCHFVPQTDFIFDSQNGTQLVEFVLYYERLHEDFKSMVQHYPELEVLGELPVKNEAGKDVKHFDHKLTVSNMTSKTLRQIEMFYKRDFEILGYEMINHDTN